MNIDPSRISFSELMMQHIQYMSRFGIDLCIHILQFAGIPTVIASYLWTLPARPLDTPTLIVEAGFSFDGHLLLFAGLLFFSVASIIICMQISTIHAQYCIEHGEAPNRDFIMQNLMEYMPKAIGAFFLLYFAISIGLILCIFPGIYIMSAGILLFPLMQDTRFSIFVALQLSIRLIRNHALKPLAFIILLTFITSIPSTALAYLSDISIPFLDSSMPRIIFMLLSLIRIVTLGLISVFGVILHKELLKGTDFATPIAPIK